jgi:glycosyltransferase involved in cell wall biosynthesis
LEPFFGGSHKDFAQGLVSHSRHKIDSVTLPARFWKWLSYPEIIPKAFHDDFLYQDQNELVEKLCFVISNYQQFRIKCQNLSAAMSRFAWENLIGRYDEILERLALTEKSADPIII